MGYYAGGGGGLRPPHGSGGGGAGERLLDKHVEKMLSEPWGAAKAGVHFSKETLGALCEQFSRLEPQARRGALQGTLFMRLGQRHGLEAEVRSLVDLGSGDKDQWVNLIARALGGLTERFDLQQLQQDVPAVADALASIRDKIQVDGTPDTYRPLEEMYLSPRLLTAAGAPPCEGPTAHGHFTLRARREPKKKTMTGGVAASTGGLKTAGHASAGSLPDMLTGGGGGDSFRARSGLSSGVTAGGGAHRRPAPTAAANSMFAPPSRKPSTSGMAFFRDSGPTKRAGLGGGGTASARAFLAGRNKKEGVNKTMMIDVSEAAQLGTVKGEDLQKEQKERDKQREQQERELKRKQEQEEKQRRIQKMMEEREQKKKMEAERKRAREEDAAKRKEAHAAKRMRTEGPAAGREGVATPSPQEEPIHGF